MTATESVVESTLQATTTSRSTTVSSSSDYITQNSAKKTSHQEGTICAAGRLNLGRPLGRPRVSTMIHSSITPHPPNQCSENSGPHSHNGAEMTMKIPMTFYFGNNDIQMLFAGVTVDCVEGMAAAFVTMFFLAVSCKRLKRAL